MVPEVRVSASTISTVSAVSTVSSISVSGLALEVQMCHVILGQMLGAGPTLAAVLQTNGCPTPAAET